MEYRRLFDILPYQLAKYPQKEALVMRRDRKWLPFSTKACLEMIDRVSAGLLKLGLKRGDTIGIITEGGSPQWNFIDFAAQQIGAIPVPIHAPVTMDEVRYILKDAAISFVLTGNKSLHEKILEADKSIGNLNNIYCLEKNVNKSHWDDLISEPEIKYLAEIEARKAAIHEDDLATIIYTSGTTGNPKGVMLSHKNIISNIKATIALVPVNCDKKVVSFLPLSHVFERMVTYTYMAVGASIYYSDSMDRIMDHLKDVKPHYFTSVPRILEKVYHGILDAANDKNRLQRKIIHWALRVGERYPDSNKVSLPYWFKLRLANIFVYRKWRSIMGNRVEGIIVGAAALQPQLASLFAAAGINVREGYGLTETSPVIAFNRFEPGGVRFGTVGIPIPSVDVKINDPDERGEGEIIVKGPNVMMGYFNQPDETKKVIDQNGWFHTGDVGTFVNKRFLQITGRKKDIFKTTTGKYVRPEMIADKLCHSPYFEHALVLGFNKPYVAALIVPDYVKLKDWCDVNNVHWTAPQFMAINPKVIQFVKDLIEEMNETLSPTEKVREFLLLHKEWSPATGELTATLKLKRPFIESQYQEEIEELFSKS